MLTKMFTVTADVEEQGDSECLLFFHKTEGSFTEDEIYALASDPLCQQLMGDTLLASVVHESEGESLLLSREFLTKAIVPMSAAAPNDTVTMVTPGNGVQMVNLQKVYYGCTLPQRAIVGCKTCADSETKQNCILKEQWRRVVTADEYDDFTAEDAIDALTNRKSTIAGFTYVSPKLTQTKAFTSTYRTYSDHDFSMVEENSDTIKRGLQERSRKQRFIKEACSTCLVREACDSWSTPTDVKYCKGPYIETEAEAHKAIVKNSKIPFTNKQLLFLALNSGELGKRYNRCISWATFMYDYNRGLHFGIRRKNTGHILAQLTFEEAEKVIRTYNSYVYEIQDHKPLSMQQKAVLLELAGRDWSPNFRSGWHRTQYQALGIVYSPHGKKWILNFKFNSSSGYYRPYGMLLPWEVQASTLADVYQHYGNLETLSKESHHLSRGRFFGYDYYY